MREAACSLLPLDCVITEQYLVVERTSEYFNMSEMLPGSYHLGIGLFFLLHNLDPSVFCHWTFFEVIFVSLLTCVMFSRMLGLDEFI